MNRRKIVDPIKPYLPFTALSTLGQFLAIVSLFIVSALFSPEEIGKFGIVVSIATTVSIVATLNLESKVLSVEEDRDAFRLSGLAFAFSLFLTAFLWIILKFVESLIPLTAPWSWQMFNIWVPLFTLLFSVFRILSNLILRFQYYKSLAKRQVIQNSAIILCQLILSPFSTSSKMLLISECVGRSVGLLLLFKSIWKKVIANLETISNEVTKTKFNVGKIIRWTFPGPILEVLAVSLPVIVIGWHYGVEAAGQIALVERVISIPVTFLGATIGKVVLGEMSSYFRNQNLLALSNIRKWMKSVLLLSLLATFLTYALIISVFLVTSSFKWIELEKILLYIFPSFVLAIVWNVFSNLFISYGMFKEFTQFALLRLFLVAIVLSLAIFEDFTFVFAYCTICYLVAILELFWLLRIMTRFGIDA